MGQEGNLRSSIFVKSSTNLLISSTFCKSAGKEKHLPGPKAVNFAAT
jgi:hypothetical protein